MPEQPIRNKPVPPQEAPKPAPKPAHPPGPAGGAKPAAVAPKPAQQQPAAAQPKVRAPAPSARAQLRHWLTLLSFLLFVGVPSIGTGLYLMAVAVDQYASKVGFSVRREDTSSALEVLGGLSSLSGSSSSDTDILYEFIQSQKLVSDINEELDLKRIWSGPGHDVVFALKEDASIEELVAYWNRMVRVSYGSGSGLIEVEVPCSTVALE